MALIAIRVDRTSKPPLGTPLRSDGHWSVQGLTGAWGLNEGGGSSITEALTGTPTATPTPLGQFGYSGGAVKLPVSCPPNRKLTLFSVSIKRSIPTEGGIALSVGSYDPTSALYAWVGIRTSGVATGGMGVSVTAINDTQPWDNGETAALCLTISSTSLAFYNNGRKIGTAIKTLLGVNDAHLMGLESGGAQFPGDVVFASIYSRPLLPGEAISLSSNPWQIYEPETVWVESGGEIISLLSQSAWKISSALHAPCAWEVKSIVVLDSAWKIKDLIYGQSSWKVFGEDRVQSSWKIKNNFGYPVAWKIKTSIHAGSEWIIINGITEDVAWEILTSIAGASEWKIHNKTRSVTSWAVNSGLIPEPVKVFSAPGRQLIYSAVRQVLIITAPKK